VRRDERHDHIGRMVKVAERWADNQGERCPGHFALKAALEEQGFRQLPGTVFYAGLVLAPAKTGNYGQARCDSASAGDCAFVTVSATAEEAA
jgi:hypothetical protein